MNVQSLEGLKIEGDVEIEIDAGAGGMGPLFAYYFGQEAAKIAMQLMNFAKAVGYPVENLLQPVAVASAISPAPKDLAAAAAAVPAFKIASALASAKFSVGIDKTWRNTIQEVTLGATKANGGCVKAGRREGYAFLPGCSHAPCPQDHHGRLRHAHRHGQGRQDAL